jgi:hypothetical protein
LGIRLRTCGRLHSGAAWPNRSAGPGPPARFEAGTATLAGLGAAVEYLESIGMVNAARYEQELLLHAAEALKPIPGLRLIGTASERAGVISFVIDGMEVGVGSSARRRRHRSTSRCTLCTADDGPIWCIRHGSPVARALQHPRRDRPARARGPKPIEAMTCNRAWLSNGGGEERMQASNVASSPRRAATRTSSTKCTAHCEAARLTLAD